jgi:CDP-paratose 2-epimerase
MLALAQKPRCGEVYNLGGGFENSCSILEAFALAAEVSGREQVRDVRRYQSLGRSYLSLQRSDEDEEPLSGLGNHQSLRQTVAEIAASWSAPLV